MKTEIIIRGTHCGACAALIKDVAKEQAGVRECEVDHTTGKTVITHEGALDLEALQRELSAVGEYEIEK